MPDTYKCAVVMRRAPRIVRGFLRGFAEDSAGDFQKLKRALHPYKVRDQAYDLGGRVIPEGAAGGHHGPTPTELDALMDTAKSGGRGARGGAAAGRGRGGKAGGRGQEAQQLAVRGGGGGKGSSKRGERTGAVQCWGCGQFGHRQAQCPAARPADAQRGQRLPKGGRKGKAKGKAKEQTTAFTGTCFTCGRVGHRAADCRRVQLLEEEGEVAVEGAMPALDEEEPWVMPVESGELTNDDALIMVVSGSYARVCPTWATQYSLQRPSGKERPMALTADGRPLPTLGDRRVTMQLRSGHRVTATFKVMPVRRPILSVAELAEHGMDAHFDHSTGAYLTRSMVRSELVKCGKLYLLPVRIGQGDGSVAAAALTPPRPTPTPEAPWMLFEWACESDSKLARWFVDSGHAAVRLHPPQWDLRGPGHVDEAVDMMIEAQHRGFNVMVWIALPCTSWSGWQHANRAIGGEMKEMIEVGRRESIVMVEQVARAARMMRDASIEFEMAFEWPRGAAGWNDKKAADMLRDTGMEHSCEFDGCAYSLVSAAGVALQKPWRVCTTMRRLVQPLSQKCHHGREHGQCRGADAVASGLYTPQLVRTIGRPVTGGVNRGVLNMVAPLPEPDTELTAEDTVERQAHNVQRWALTEEEETQGRGAAKTPRLRAVGESHTAPGGHQGGGATTTPGVGESHTAPGGKQGGDAAERPQRPQKERRRSGAELRSRWRSC